jgi:hypothetical protein
MKRKKIFLTVFVFIFVLVSFWVTAEDSGDRPVAVSPGSDTEVASVWQSCPTFSWSAVKQAASYRLAIFELVDSQVTSYANTAAMSSPVISKDIPGPALSWTLSSEEGLNTGNMYAWYVQAVDDNGDALGNWSNGKIFKVEQEVRFAGIEEKLGEILKSYGVSDETITNVLKDMKPDVKEVVVRSESSKNLSKDTQGKSGVQGYEGDANTFYGLGAGASNTTGNENTFIGHNAGYANTTGNYNTFIGKVAGRDNTSASNNTFIGDFAGGYNTTGTENTLVGNGAGERNTTGNWNTCLGYVAGYSNTTGSLNTFIGRNAGFSNTTGEGNIFLGFNAGCNETSSNKLYIANSDTSSPLIYGEFDNKIVTVNGKLGIGSKTPGYPIELKTTGENAGLYLDRTDGATFKLNVTTSMAQIGTQSNHKVNFVANNSAKMTIDTTGYVGIGTTSPTHLVHLSGGAYSDGSTWQPSCSRTLKENITNLSLDEAVKALDVLNPVKFNYKINKDEDYIGFIAEDVPELVATKERKSINTMDVVAVLTKVVQEQQKTIAELKKEIAELKKK